MEQVYENYTSQDQQVWKTLFDRQIVNLPQAVTREFLSGLERIKFTHKKIPNFKETNELLMQCTGWKLHAVPGIVTDKIFFELLANKKFPATTWIRKMSQLDYLEEPDMFHDVFAHVPLLTNQLFVDFLQSISMLALDHIDDPWAIHLVSRVYWYTVEFGLIREEGVVRIYGAGILSSVGETKYCLGKKPEHLNYDVNKVLTTSYRKDIFQTLYFLINSYDQLFASIDDIKDELEELLKLPAQKEFAA